MQKKYPFKFLNAYERDDKDFFFGRDEETEALYKMVFQSNLVLLYGLSGTGKTSLIQCGLANKFKSYDWLALDVRKGKNIIAALDKKLCEESDGVFKYQERTDYPGDRPIKNLGAKIDAIYKASFKPIYLIFDQFEELYTLEPDEGEQSQFIKVVQQLLELDQSLTIIISIREEYLGHLYDFEKKVPELFRKKLRVETMHLDKVRNLLTRISASEQSNVHLEAGQEAEIAEKIFNIVKDKEKTLSIQLPYLQVFMDDLYLRKTKDEDKKTETTIRMKDLPEKEKLGDVLRHFLDVRVAAIAKLFEQEEKTIWAVLSPFVSIEGTKHPITLAELEARLPGMDKKLIGKLLNELEKNRIIRFREEEGRYEISHDSLAKGIEERRSDKEKLRMDAKRLIQSQVGLPEEKRQYFDEKTLLLISAAKEFYIPVPEEQEWIDKSQEKVDQEKAAAAAKRAKELEDAKARAEKEAGLRAAAEEQRKIAEKERKAAEVQGKIAEKARKVAEEQKKIAEKARKAAEVQKKIAERNEKKAVIRSWLAGGLFLCAFVAAVWGWNSKLKTGEALKETEVLSVRADDAFQKAKKLVDAFYFYDDKYALAFKHRRFYFIDKDGDEVGKLRKWKGAEPFDKNINFARVKSDSPISFLLLDTLGKTYEVAYDPAAINGENIKAVDFSNRILAKIPDEVFNYNNLEIVLLNSNQLKVLPPEISNLNKLTALYLNDNKLSMLPPAIGNLNKLTALGLSSNQLKVLPPEIGNLSELTALYLNDNKLSTLPPAIGNLNKLTALELSTNYLKVLPPEIEKLRELTTLYLYNNELNTLHPAIWKLDKLTALFLDYNHLRTLPSGIGKLNELKTLGLINNYLTMLPSEIGNLSELKTLGLSENKLTTLPPEIGKLSNLITLHLRKNELTSLPSEIGELKKLESLYLDGNILLKKLPAAIKQLENLTTLSLADNELTEVPVEILELKNLRSLDLRGNRLERLPDEITQLEKLKVLGLSVNPISDKERERIKKILPDCTIHFKELTFMASWYFDEKDYAKAYEIQKNSITENDKDEVRWFNLSYYALFFNKPQEAIRAAKKTLELNPEAEDVATNLALGYLLNNQWPAAEKIYQKWKGKYFLQDKEPCDSSFLRDIADLEKAGITHPDFQKVKELFAKTK